VTDTAVASISEADVEAAMKRAESVGRAVARRCKVPWLADELTSAAMVGIAEACKTWRPDGGASFSTWANHRMNSQAWDTVRSWIGRRHGRKPQSAILDYNADERDQRVGAVWAVDEAIDATATAQTIFDAALTERDRDCVLYGARGEKQDDVAERYGVTASRISQIRTKTLADLRRTAA
jgi:RNA polymerase sigma factor (sigma-70 family)